MTRFEMETDVVCGTWSLQEWNIVSSGVEWCHVQHIRAWLCATLDTHVALEGSEYIEQVCGVETDQTRREVLSDFQHLVNFKVWI